MRKHGKQNYLAFQDDEIKKMKEIFDTLDLDGSGAISVSELAEPFLGLGIVDSLFELEDMV